LTAFCQLGTIKLMLDLRDEHPESFLVYLLTL
jgi:hypothetical protein